MASTDDLLSSTTHDANTSTNILSPDPTLSVTENSASAGQSSVVSCNDEDAAQISPVEEQKHQSGTVDKKADIDTVFDKERALVTEKAATPRSAKPLKLDMSSVKKETDVVSSHEVLVVDNSMNITEGGNVSQCATGNFTDEDAKFKFAVYLSESIADWFDNEQEIASNTNPKSLLGNGDLIGRYNLLFRMCLINSSDVPHIMTPGEGDIFLARVKFQQNHNRHIKSRCYWDECEEMVAVATAPSTPGIGGWIEFLTGKSKGKVKKTPGYPGEVIVGIVKDGLSKTVFPERRDRPKDSITLERLNRSKASADWRDQTETRQLIDGYSSMVIGSPALERVSFGNDRRLTPPIYYDNGQNNMPWVGQPDQGMKSRGLLAQQQPGSEFSDMKTSGDMQESTMTMQNPDKPNQGPEYGPRDPSSYQPVPGYGGVPIVAYHGHAQPCFTGPYTAYALPDGQASRRSTGSYRIGQYGQRDDQASQSWFGSGRAGFYGPRGEQASRTKGGGGGWRDYGGKDNTVGEGAPKQPKVPRKNKNKQNKRAINQDPALDANNNECAGWSPPKRMRY